MYRRNGREPRELHDMAIHPLPGVRSLVDRQVRGFFHQPGQRFVQAQVHGLVGDARVRVAAVGAFAVVGLLAGWHLVRAERTASTAVAAALRPQLRAGDVVAYCPDQLGPATARLLPSGVTQLTFPALAAPRLVDWTDYADRNVAASGPRFADAVLGRAGAGRIFLVWSGGYRTFGTKCEATVNALTTLRPHPTAVTVADGPDGEQVGVQRFDP